MASLKLPIGMKNTETICTPEEGYRLGKYLELLGKQLQANAKAVAEAEMKKEGKKVYICGEYHFYKVDPQGYWQVDQPVVKHTFPQEAYPEMYRWTNPSEYVQVIRREGSVA